MRSALQPAVPSRRLLRYLRFQSEGIAFFSTNHGHAIAAATTGYCRGVQHVTAKHTVHIATGVRLSSRRLSTSKPRRSEAEAALHSAVLDLESILPKSLKRVCTAGTHLLDPNNAVASRRSASTSEPGEEEGRKTSWQQRLWGPNTVKPDFRTRTATDDFDTSIFTTSMTARRAKAALEPVLRCTEVDEKGEAILTDGAFKKSELIAKVRTTRQRLLLGLAPWRIREVITREERLLTLDLVRPYAP